MQSLIRSLFLLFLLAAPAAAQTVLTGNVSDGSGGPLLAGQVYHTTGFTIPSGETLTLEPGSLLKIDGGSVSVRGTLVSNAGGQRSVVSSIHDDVVGGDTNGNGGATSPSPGDWGGLQVVHGGSLHLNQVDLRYGGAGLVAPVQMEGGTLELRNTTVTRALQEGIDLRRSVNTGTLIAIDNCSIVQSGTYAIDGVALDDVPTITLIEAIANGSGDYVRVVDTTLAGDTTITLANIANLDRGALVLAGLVSIPPGITLTVEPEVVVKWEDSVMASQRGFNVSGTLRFRGERNRPVVVTSFEDDDHGGDTNEDGSSSGSPGAWAGLTALAGGTLDLEHALLRYGGSTSNRAPVQTNGGFIRMRHVAVEHSALSGMTMGNGAGVERPVPDVQRCSFNDNGAYPVDTLALHHVSGFQDNTASGNALSDSMRVNKVSVTVDAEVGPANYTGEALIVATPILVPEASLTLLRGTIIKTNSSIQMGHFTLQTPGALHLLGTAFEPVVITSFHDDTQGGDTFKDGTTTSPSLNDWLGLTFNVDAVGTLENVLLRYGNVGVNNHSADVSLRSVRTEHFGNLGFNLFELDGNAENLVAFDCLFQGIHLAGGTFDLVHATIVDCGDHGLIQFPQHTGWIRNTISWGNGNLNYLLQPSHQITGSNGVMPPLFDGNLNEEPFFVDQAGGDLHLQPISPCVDAADSPAALPVVSDHEEFSRLLDPTLSGSLQADMGAYELHRWRMEVTGQPHVGSSMFLEVTGPAPGASTFWLSFSGASQLDSPLGFAMVGAPASRVYLGMRPVNSPQRMRIPYAPSLVGQEFRMQSLTLGSTSPVRGEWTNLYRGCILPRRLGKAALLSPPPELSAGVIQLR